MGDEISAALLTRPAVARREYSWRPPMLDSAATGLALEILAAEKLVPGDCAAKQLVWRSPSALIVTRTDTRLPRFAEAAAALRAQGWPVLVRESGGGACPIGAGTVQCALVRAQPRGASSIDEMYRALAEWIREALEEFGISTGVGPVPGAFCPGNYEIVAGQKKIAGMAQHWRAGGGSHVAAATASLNVEDDPESLATVVNEFYRLAGGNYRCVASTITSMRAQLASTGREPADLIGAWMEQLSRTPGNREFEA